MNFQLEVEDDGELLVLRLRGELDLATIGQVQETIDRYCPGRRAVVVDLSALEFMDSSGLRVMVELQRRDDGTTVAFLPAGDRVARLLSMTGVANSLNWVDRPEDALERAERA